MGDAGDPFGPGVVPLLQGQLLAEQQNRSVVQLPGQSGGRTVLRQVQRLHVMQVLDAPRHGFQGFIETDAEKKGEKKYHQQVAEDIGSQIRGQGVQRAHTELQVIFGDRTFFFRDHKKPVGMFPDLHRVIFQIPAGHRGDVRERIGERNLLRQVPAPDHLSLLVDQHGKGIAVVYFPGGVF